MHHFSTRATTSSLGKELPPRSTNKGRLNRLHYRPRQGSQFFFLSLNIPCSKHRVLHRWRWRLSPQVENWEPSRWRERDLESIPSHGFWVSFTCADTKSLSVGPIPSHEFAQELGESCVRVSSTICGEVAMPGHLSCKSCKFDRWSVCSHCRHLLILSYLIFR